MWYIVVFQPFKCRNTNSQPQIWSIWPIFPNDSESLPKVCYIKQKNSEILSRLGALGRGFFPYSCNIDNFCRKYHLNADICFIPTNISFKLRAVIVAGTATLSRRARRDMGTAGSDTVSPYQPSDGNYFITESWKCQYLRVHHSKQGP